MDRAASPGTRLASTKVRADTPRSRGTAVSSQLVTSVRMPALPSSGWVGEGDGLLGVVPVERRRDGRRATDLEAAEVGPAEVQDRTERHRREPRVLDEVLLQLPVEVRTRLGVGRGGLRVELGDRRVVGVEAVEHGRGRQEETLTHEEHRL